MKKSLFLLLLMAVLFSGCKFKFLRVLQPEKALVSTSLYYPIDIHVYNDSKLAVDSYFSIEVPQNMTVNVGEVIPSFMLNGENVEIETKDSLTNDDLRAYEFKFVVPGELTSNCLQLVMSLNSGSVGADCVIKYRTGAIKAQDPAINDVQTFDLTVVDAQPSLSLLNAECMDSIGSIAKPFDFYIKYISMNGSSVSDAQLILTAEGQDDLSYEMSPLGLSGQDYFASINLPTAGNYNYYMSFDLSDGSTLRYPSTGVLTGPIVTDQESVVTPFLEDFEETSTTRDLWSVTDGPISLFYGMPAGQNKVSAYSYEGVYALGSNITGDGLYDSENTGYYVSPYINIADAEEVLLDFRYRNYSEDSVLNLPCEISVCGDDENWVTVMNLNDSTPNWKYYSLDLSPLVYGNYVRFRFTSAANEKNLDEGIMFDNIGLNANPNYIDVDFVDLQESLPAGESHKIDFYISNRGIEADNYTIRVYNGKYVGDALDYVRLEDIHGGVLGETGELVAEETKHGVFIVDLPETPDDDSYKYVVKVWSNNDPNMFRSQTVNVEVDKDSGGPDDYGYTWVNSRNESCEDFNWVNTDDHRVIPFDQINYSLNFTNEFDFYGNDYYNLYLNGKGYITFGAASAESTINEIPNAIVPNAYVSFLANNTRCIDLSTVITEGVVNGWGPLKEKMKVITFHNIANQIGNAKMDVQILFNDLNDIRIQYDSIDDDFNLDSYHVGIENADGTDGLQYQYGLGRLSDSLVIEFRHPGRDNFSEFYPEYNCYDDVSVFTEFSWLPPRGAQSVCLYLAEMNTPLDSSTIVYSGKRITSFDPELKPNTFYDYELEAVLSDGSVVRTTTNTFKTMRNMVTVSGTVYAEDGVTRAANIPINMTAGCLLQGTYEGFAVTDEMGHYEINMPACEELDLEIESKMCEPYSQTVLLEDTTDVGLMIYNDITITTQPVFTSFTFNVDDEIVEEADSIVYFYVSPSTCFWYGGLKYLIAEATFPSGVTCSVDIDTLMGYDNPRSVELTTVGGRSQIYTIKYSVLAGLYHFINNGEVYYDKVLGTCHFGPYINKTYWTLDLNNEGANTWEDAGITMTTTRPDWVGEYNHTWSVGMAPAEFILRPTNPEDRINMVRFNFFENCGENCSYAKAFREGVVVDQVIPKASEEDIYRLRMYDDPADEIRFFSYESTVSDITVWLEKGGGNPELCTEVLCDNKKLNDTLDVSVEIYKQDEESLNDWERIWPIVYAKDGKYWAKLVPGKYIIRAIPANPDSINFNPTYSGDVATWGKADTITLNYQDLIEYTINSHEIEETQGANSIEGSIEIVEVKDKSTASSSSHLFGYRIMLYNANTDELVAYALTDILGNYVFENIPAGSYYIIAEREGMATSPRVDVEVPDNNAKVDVSDVFTFNTIDLAITTLGGVTDNKDCKSLDSQNLEVYPNPTKEMIYIQGAGEVFSYSLFNQMGACVKSGNNNAAISIKDLNSGIYLLQVELPEAKKVIKIIKI